jgi:hypothetical protein
MRLNALLFALVLISFLLTASAADKPMNLKVDHATICGSDLDRLRAGFAGMGLTPDYVGRMAMASRKWL